MFFFGFTIVELATMQTWKKKYTNTRLEPKRFTRSRKETNTIHILAHIFDQSHVIMSNLQNKPVDLLP